MFKPVSEKVFTYLMSETDTSDFYDMVCLVHPTGMHNFNPWVNKQQQKIKKYQCIKNSIKKYYVESSNLK